MSQRILKSHFRRDLVRYAEFMNIGGQLGVFKIILFAILGIGPIQSVMLYRISRWILLKKIPFIHYFFVRLNMLLHGAEISAYADFGPGLFIAHPQGIVVGKNVNCGDNITIFQNVTIGAKTPFDGLEQMPTIESGVTLYAGCIVLGDICIGRNSKIGANVVVTSNIEENSIIVVDKSMYKNIIHRNSMREKMM